MQFLVSSKSKIHICKKFRCSTYNHKGVCACSNNWKIDKEWIENVVLNIIKKNYFTNKKIEKNIDNLYKELSNINTTYMKEAKIIENKIKQIDIQIHNLLDSIKNGIDPKLVVDEINNLKITKEDLELKRNNILNNIDNQPKIKRKDIEEYFYNFQSLFLSSTVDKKRTNKNIY